MGAYVPVDLTTTCTFKRMVPSLGFGKYKQLVIETPATANATDTITFLKSVWGTVVGGTAFDATTGLIEALSIALVTDTYTITVGTGDAEKRVYVFWTSK